MSTTNQATQPLWLELDYTGTSPDNLVTFEYHTVQNGQPSILKCDYGPYYRESLLVNQQVANQTLLPLTEGVDYTCAELDPVTTAKTGKEIYRAILIINPNLSGIYALSYQALGGSDNTNLALAFQQAEQPLSDSTAVDFTTIQQTPTTYPPVAHQHDLKDFFGTEYLVNFMGGMKKMVQSKFVPYGGTPSSAKDAELYAAVTNFKNTINADNAILVQAISEHIANTGYPHLYSKAMLQLQNVSDGGFVALNDSHGNPLPVYASPATLGKGLATLPPQQLTNHKTLTNNPHGDSKSNVGLSAVVNLPMITTYTLAQSQYVVVLDPNAQQQYLSPYVLVNAINEAQAAQVESFFTTPIATVTAPGTGLLALADAQNTAAQSSIADANATLATTETAISDAQTKLASAQAANANFSLVNFNAPYAALLSALLSYDYSNTGNGSQTAVDGYYPVPSLLDSLYLWLDVGYSKNNYQVDGSGNTRLMGLTDRSPSARLFVANSLTTAPTYTDSQDITQGKVGISVGKIASFSAGNHMDQISGPAVCLKPGMTVIALVHTFSSTTTFTLLSDTNATPQAIIQVQPVPDKAIKIDSTLWTPLQAAASTIDEYTSTIIVASVAELTETQCWLATCNPLPNGYPRGVDTPPTTWPSSFIQSAPMTRIGNSDALSSNGGELAELIIFNRQLSFAECQAVIDYLRLAKTHNQALVVDTSAKNAF